VVIGGSIEGNNVPGLLNRTVTILHRLVRQQIGGRGVIDDFALVHDVGAIGNTRIAPTPASPPRNSSGSHNFVTDRIKAI
jgi:hypothetical protein